MHVEPSIIVDVLTPVVMNIASTSIGIVKSIVFISQSLIAFEWLRCVGEALVDGLSRRNEFIVAIDGRRGRLEAAREWRDLLENATLLQLQVDVQTTTSFREIQVLELRQLSLRLLAVLQVERSESCNRNFMIICLFNEYYLDNSFLPRLWRDWKDFNQVCRWEQAESASVGDVMLRLKRSIMIEVAVAAVSDAVGSACLMIKLSVLIDLGAVVVGALIWASFVILRSIFIINRHNLHAFAAVPLLVDCSMTTMDYELNLRWSEKDEVELDLALNKTPTDSAYDRIFAHRNFSTNI